MTKFNAGDVVRCNIGATPLGIGAVVRMLCPSGIVYQHIGTTIHDYYYVRLLCLDCSQTVDSVNFTIGEEYVFTTEELTPYEP